MMMGFPKNFLSRPACRLLYRISVGAISLNLSGMKELLQTPVDSQADLKTADAGVLGQIVRECFEAQDAAQKALPGTAGRSFQRGDKKRLHQSVAAKKSHPGVRGPAAS